MLFIVGGVLMYNNKKDGHDNDAQFFIKVKKCMLKMCEDHPDIIEFQLFKENLEQAKSFKDLDTL